MNLRWGIRAVAVTTSSESQKKVDHPSGKSKGDCSEVASEAILCHVAVGEYSIVVAQQLEENTLGGDARRNWSRSCSSSKSWLDCPMGQMRPTAMPASYNGAVNGNYAMPMVAWLPLTAAETASLAMTDANRDAIPVSKNVATTTRIAIAAMDSVSWSRRLFSRRGNCGPGMGTPLRRLRSNQRRTAPM